MITLALLLAAAPAPALDTAPKTGPIKAFGAWVVACDNVRRCEMTSIWAESSPPENPLDMALEVAVKREPGPTGGWTVEIHSTDEPFTGTLRVASDRGLDLQVPSTKGELRFTGLQAAQIVAAMVNSTSLTVASGNKPLGVVSLKGSSAALRFIDAEQGRAGTVTAAVAKGERPASAVPAAAPLPRVSYARPSGTVARLTPAMRKQLDQASECGEAYGEGVEPPEAESYALGGGKTLVLLPCGGGAYNFSSDPYILTPGGKPERAQFDAPTGFGEDGSPPSLVNASFDPATGELSSYAKGRGIGDCGSSETFVWDGTRFRLIEARLMPECRGSMNKLAIWRAEAVAK